LVLFAINITITIHTRAVTVADEGAEWVVAGGVWRVLARISAAMSGH